MNKQEAIKAMQTHRVRHRFFNEGEWVTILTTGEYCFEDGTICPSDKFWKDRHNSHWNDGWSIIPNNERSVG